MCAADLTEIHHDTEPTESINEFNDVNPFTYCYILCIPTDIFLS